MNAETMSAIEDAWRRVLDVDTARDDDNFFELGGDSIKLIQFVEEVEDAVPVLIPLETLFLEGTLASVKAGCRPAQTAA